MKKKYCGLIFENGDVFVSNRSGRKYAKRRGWVTMDMKLKPIRKYGEEYKMLSVGIDASGNPYDDSVQFVPEYQPVKARSKY